MAHQASLQANGNTIAVIPSGFNYIYPKENINLYHNILKNNGLIISEYSPETKVESKNFLERNRIVSGIALGILVIEAKHRSGTSVTARMAAEQNRKVFVLPHEINDRCGIGTNRLIRKGAILITSTKEIINECGVIEYKEIPSKINLEEIEKKNKKRPKNKDQQMVYDLLGTETKAMNEICAEAGESISKISNILFELEIEGYIKKTIGGYRVL